MKPSSATHHYGCHPGKVIKPLIPGGYRDAANIKTIHQKIDFWDIESTGSVVKISPPPVLY